MGILNCNMMDLFIYLSYDICIGHSSDCNVITIHNSNSTIVA